MLHEVDDAAVVLERRLGHRVGALVGETDLEALVQEGHDLQPFHDGLGPELGFVEDRGVRPEGHRGPRPGLAAAAVLRRRPDSAHVLLDLAALLELGLPVLAVPVDLEHEPGREGVDDRDAHAVQAARDLVALAAELAAGVERGQDDLGRRDLGVLRVRTDRDACAVVDHPDPAVGQDGDVDPGGAPGHGLVDRVVHDLPHQVVQARRSGRADVHARALPDRLEALEDGDVGFTVGGIQPRPMSRPPLLPQARPFKTLVFAVRIESPDGRPPAFRCERTILPDNRVISALLNGRNIPRQRRVSGPFDDDFQPLYRAVAQRVHAGQDGS